MMIRSVMHLGARSELLRQTGRAAPKRSISSNSLAPHNAHLTLENLKIGRHTRVIFQGFTGPSPPPRRGRHISSISQSIPN